MAPIIENGSNNNIPDDLALSILSKLPFKSMKRFTCVRKSWSLLFDNPQFMRMYRHNFRSNCHYDDDYSCLILKNYLPLELIWMSRKRFGERVNLDWLTLPEDNHPRYFYLLGFGNGIHGTLCICEDNRLKNDVVLWNPTTGETQVVPPNPFNPNDILSNYEFNVSHCGFGYDHVNDDYKLIRCIFFWGFYLTIEESIPENGPKELSNNIWEIYSVRSNTWRILDVNMAVRLHHDTVGNDMYMNGVCHWIGYPGYGEEQFLVSFNLSTETVLTTPLPSHLNDPSILIRLGQLNGSIALISYRFEASTSFDVSICGETGVKESWTKLFTFGPLPCFRNLCGVGKKGDIFFIKDDDELACFNLSTEMIEMMGVYERSHMCQLMMYEESILPIGL